MPKVKIEEVSEDTQVGDGEPSSKRVKISNFEKTMQKVRRASAAIEEKRQEVDFMYMMITAKNPQRKRNHITGLISTLKKTYKDSPQESGFSKIHLNILERIEKADNQDLFDAMWFMELAELPSLSYWMLNGEPGVMPAPELGNKEMFQYFLRSDSFRDLCNSLLDGNIDVDTFAIAMRSEYFMTVGPVEIKDKVYQELNMDHQPPTQGVMNKHLPQITH